MKKDSDICQDLSNKRGEVRFREKLSVQHVTGEMVLPDYYDKVRHDKILQDRVDIVRANMARVKKRGVSFSPFLEVGAERGQNAMVLSNDYGALGAAIDISFHQLRSMEYYAGLFLKGRMPLRICCDAYALPFRSGTFRFAFCYEVLHHFPSPRPITMEVHRVLGNGHFYFDGEPFRRILKWNLYRRKHKVSSAHEARKSRLRRYLESIVTEPFSDEEAHGVLENDKVAIHEWIDSVKGYDDVDMQLYLEKGILETSFKRRLRAVNYLNMLFGRRISGLCRKGRPSADNSFSLHLESQLACPNCADDCNGIVIDRPCVEKYGDTYRCVRCGSIYPIVDGVAIMLPQREFKELYPEYYRGR
ncbi:MAG: methyltransferase domain-containing protein [Dehalococcoidales bacterium]|nr:methyltransferase domain-containing protein [Dehalococcoidales bacterium]